MYISNNNSNGQIYFILNDGMSTPFNVAVTRIICTIARTIILSIKEIICVIILVIVLMQRKSINLIHLIGCSVIVLMRRGFYLLCYCSVVGNVCLLTFLWSRLVVATLLVGGPRVSKLVTATASLFCVTTIVIAGSSSCDRRCADTIAVILQIAPIHANAALVDASPTPSFFFC